MVAIRPASAMFCNALPNSTVRRGQSVQPNKRVSLHFKRELCACPWTLELRRERFPLPLAVLPKTPDSALNTGGNGWENIELAEQRLN